MSGIEILALAHGALLVIAGVGVYFIYVHRS